MALVNNPDIMGYLLYLLSPKEFIRFGRVNKLANSLVRYSAIYQELCRLKFDKKVHKFGSYSIIKRYYTHNMINVIIHYQFDYCRAVILAAKYGHLAILKLIHETTCLHFPLAVYGLRTQNLIKKAIDLAISNKHYHIMKWFESVGIIDNWILPQKIYHESVDMPLLHPSLIKYASTRGDLPMLQYLQQNIDSFHCHWHNIVTCAVEQGHIVILEWILTITKDKFHVHDELPSQDIELPKPDQMDPEKKLFMLVLDWLGKNSKKFPNKLNLRYYNVCLHGCPDLFVQINNRLAFDTLSSIFRYCSHW